MAPNDGTGGAGGGCFNTVAGPVGLMEIATEVKT